MQPKIRSIRLIRVQKKKVFNVTNTNNTNSSYNSKIRSIRVQKKKVFNVTNTNITNYTNSSYQKTQGRSLKMDFPFVSSDSFDSCSKEKSANEHDELMRTLFE